MRKPQKYLTVHGTIDGHKAAFMLSIPKELLPRTVFVAGRSAIDLSHRYAELGESLVSLVSHAISNEDMLSLESPRPQPRT